MTDGMILLKQDHPGIAIIQFNRPDARNAFTLGMMRQFRSILSMLEHDQDVRVIIIAGEGKGFCAGLDLKSLETGPGGAHHGAAPNMALQELFGFATIQMRRMPQPIIAAVNGAAVGAGFALALAADIRVADNTAKFLIGAVKIGLSAGETGISYHLPRLIGAGRAFPIMLTGRAIEAEEALNIGLVSQLTETAQLFETALALARAILANSPYAVAKTKQIMWTNLDSPSLEAAIQLENHVQVVALLSQDFQEGARAFAEKRDPVFRGL